MSHQPSRVAVTLLLVAAGAGCRTGAGPKAPAFERFTTSRAGPATLADVPVAADAAAFRKSLEPRAGENVEWELRSWGAEATDMPGGFVTPDARLGGVHERVRFIAPSFPEGTTLTDVWQQLGVVVACPAHDERGEPRFLHQDGTTSPPGKGALVRGRIWGGGGQGEALELWLVDCEWVRR
jgi:hypothetical protein